MGETASGREVENIVSYSRMDFAIPGPRCSWCDKPKMVCYTQPCDGALNQLADSFLAMEMNTPRPKPVPLIKGGQGRRRIEVDAYANTICILAFVCVVVGACMWWGMR